MTNHMKKTMGFWAPAGVALLVLAIMLGQGSCASLSGPSPIAIVSAQIVIGDDGIAQHLVGVHYSLLNSSAKDIASVHISFYLYDTSGNPVPAGNNYFDITYSPAGGIPVGTEITGATSLDSEFSYTPPVSLVATQFHPYEVDFADGSSWTDWLGQYIYPYQIPSVQAQSP